MPTSQRLWDSAVISEYLTGNLSVQKSCEDIMDSASRGETRILVSALTRCELAYLGHLPDIESEQKINEFFDRPYISTISIGSPLGPLARDLIRRHRGTSPGIRLNDAVHLAIAIQHQISVIETTDGGLQQFDKQEGTPLITIRQPLYDGPPPPPPPPSQMRF